MKIVMKGVTRIVFVFKNVVVKIPKFTCEWDHFVRGLLANIDERDTWRSAHMLEDGDKSHLLCPVKWVSWGGWILIMQRVDRCFEDEDHDKHDISEHKKYFEGDDTVSNYGILNGKVVKIDYGQL